MAKLNEGVKFDEVARTFSEDKARQGRLDVAERERRDLVLTVMAGGSLGWKTKGSLDPKFEEVAFALEPSSTSSPKFAEVKTEFGYHIIMVSFCRYVYRYRRGVYNGTSGGRTKVESHARVNVKMISSSVWKDKLFFCIPVHVPMAYQPK